VDFNKTEKVVYEKYKAVLHGANVQQVTRKNASAWKSFFELNKKKKGGELPKWIKPKPPHKKRDDLFLLIRNDRYKIEGNERNSNFWNYSSIINRFKDVAQEYSIKIKPVNEANTSKTCSLCGEIHEDVKIERGLFKCPHTGEVINADLNGAINILHIPESVEDRGKWLKAQPVVYRWTNGAGNH
jgi:transposase